MQAEASELYWRRGGADRHLVLLMKGVMPRASLIDEIRSPHAPIESAVNRETIVGCVNDANDQLRDVLAQGGIFTSKADFVSPIEDFGFDRVSEKALQARLNNHGYLVLKPDELRRDFLFKHPVSKLPPLTQDVFLIRPGVDQLICHQPPPRQDQLGIKVTAGITEIYGDFLTMLGFIPTKVFEQRRVPKVVSARAIVMLTLSELAAANSPTT